MVIDASVVISIILRQAGWENFRERIIEAPMVRIAAPSVVEAVLYLTGHLEKDATLLVPDLLAALRVEIIPFAERHIWIACKANGAGTLDFEERMAYAAAIDAKEILLGREGQIAVTGQSP